jgi:hypothetical protein
MAQSYRRQCKPPIALLGQSWTAHQTLRRHFCLKASMFIRTIAGRRILTQEAFRRAFG